MGFEVFPWRRGLDWKVAVGALGLLIMILIIAWSYASPVLVCLPSWLASRCGSKS